MHYNVLLLVTTLTLGLSWVLLYRVGVLEEDFRGLKGHISLRLKTPDPEKPSDGILSGIVSTTWARTRPSASSNPQQATLSLPKSSLRRVKREERGYRSQCSFLQLSANANKQPFLRGNETVIPWAVAVQQGTAMSSQGNRILVQEDGYYMVFGQVLFQSPSTIMGYIVRSRGSGGVETGQRSTELMRCLQEMPQEMPQNSANTCYTAGIVKLEQRDELELLIPDRPQAQVSMDADSTFFGIMQLN